MAVRVIVPILLGTLLVACSSASNDPEPSPTPRPTVDSGSPAARLNNVGFFCTPSPGPGEDFTATDETCEVDGENVALYTFATAEDRENWRTQVYEPVCEILVGRTLYTVEDGLMVIAPVSEKLATQIADVLGANLRTLNC